MSNIVNFPIIPRATATAPEDESDPHTASIEQIKKAIQDSVRRCGKAWTFNVLKGALEVDGSPDADWRQKARAMFSKETV